MRPAPLLLAFWLSLGASPALRAEDDPYRVLPEKEARGMLRAHLEAQANARFAERKIEVAAIRTPEEIRGRKARMSAWLEKSLGKWPERTPLNPKVTGSFEGDGYRVEKVVFESRPNHHVTAALYLPKDAPTPYPGVLIPCGHSANGKAAETYQRASILIAKNGMAALCYDPLGQGERVQVLDDKGKSPLPGSTTEHTMAGIGSILIGRQFATDRIWDGLRAMDYLASRPEVDAMRLGCTGNSGGGTLTSYLMAIDDRIAVAAPSCYLTTLERLFATIGPQDAEQNITGQVAAGFDHADFLTLRAPKPTLICVATRDFFDIDGAWTTFREAKRLYGQLGYGERVELFEYDDTHGFSKPRREAAMRWLRRWLVGKNDSPKEPDFPIATDAQLQVTKIGQVLTEFPGERSIFQVNADEAKALAAQRKGRRGPLALDKIREGLGLPFADHGLVPKHTLPEVDLGDRALHRFTVRNTDGFEIPMRVLRPKAEGQNREASLHLVIGADPKFLTSERALGWIKAGDCVATVDLRGMGETGPAPPKPGVKPGYFGGIDREAFLALHIGRPLLTQRIEDLRRAVEAASRLNLPWHAERSIHVLGIGEAGPVAMLGAVIEPRILSVETNGSINSFEEVVGASVTRGQLASAVPGLLKVIDLPEVPDLIRPRTVSNRNPIKPDGTPRSE